MGARRLTECALMAALLVAVQYALGFVAGIELVTAVFAPFCAVFGAKSGILTGAAFSLLRCLIYGFYPSVVLLYLIYYTLFSLVFGHVGGRPPAPAPTVSLLLAMSASAAFLGTLGVRVSVVYQTKLRIMLYILSALLAALAIFYIAVSIKYKGSSKRESFLETATVAAIAAALTVCFTLLDDLITPLMMGYSKEAAAGYFYGGFLAMIPQTVCAVVSVSALYMPLKRLFLMIKSKTPPL